MEIEELANRYSFAGIKDFWIETLGNGEITIVVDLTRQDEELLNCVTSMQVGANWVDNIRGTQCLELYIDPTAQEPIPFSGLYTDGYNCVKLHIKVGGAKQ